MSEIKNFNFLAVNDEDTSLQSKNGGKFGLNTNCHFSTIEFTDKAGKDETEGNAVDINIVIGDKEYKRRIYSPEGKSLYKNGNPIEPNEDGYTEILNKELSQATAMIVHAVKATGVTQEDITTTLIKTQAKDFVSFSQVLISLLPINYKEKEIDVFLQYQWDFSEGQDVTYLELPKNMKQKYWVVSSTPNVEWEEVKDNNGIIYIDNKGNKHKIEKSASFLNTPFAKQQNKKDTSGDIGNNYTEDRSEW